MDRKSVSVAASSIALARASKSDGNGNETDKTFFNNRIITDDTEAVPISDSYN